MRIGELAQATGVSIDTLRYYERIGLLPRVRRLDNGYREYPPAIENRVRVIRNAVELGFPLQEIANVLRVRDEGGTPCRQVRDYASTIVEQLDQRIAELQRERRLMRAMIANWNTRLAGARSDERVHLLEHTGRKTSARRISRPRA